MWRYAVTCVILLTVNACVLGNANTHDDEMADAVEPVSIKKDDDVIYYTHESVVPARAVKHTRKYGTWVTEDNNLQLEKYGYFIYSAPYLHEIDHYSVFFNCVQVGGMEDKALQDRINSSLTEYFYLLAQSTLGGQYYTLCELSVHFQSPRYLSVENSFEYYDGTGTMQCATVDMQTGELVFFDDLIDLSDAFAMRIKTGGIVKVDERWYEGREREWTLEERSEDVRVTNEKYSEFDPDFILSLFYNFKREKRHWEINPYYSLRSNSYIVSDAIHYKISGCYEYILIEDIKEFLKVPAW